MDKGSEDVNVTVKFKKEDCERKRTEAFIVVKKNEFVKGRLASSVFVISNLPTVHSLIATVES